MGAKGGVVKRLKTDIISSRIYLIFLPTRIAWLLFSINVYGCFKDFNDWIDKTFFYRVKIK